MLLITRYLIPPLQHNIIAPGKETHGTDRACLVVGSIRCMVFVYHGFIYTFKILSLAEEEGVEPPRRY